MGTHRRKLARLPHVQVTPEVAFSFLQCKKLATQCTCVTAMDHCKACRAWFHAMAQIRNALKLSPVMWPCIPEPGPREPSDGARALYEELSNAISG